MIPRDFFPNMPDEIFYMWLEPFTERYGWPFNSPYDSIIDTNWFSILCGIELLYWVTVGWIKTWVEFKTIPFNYGSHLSFYSIRQRCVKGRSTLFAGVERSEGRFGACADYIRLHGEIPGSIVVIVRNGQVEIVDGNHRIAALLHVGIPHGYKVPLWYPTLKNS
jgi:hypothetical protein